MSLAIVHSRAQTGIDAPPVAVEVHLANGLPSLSIVGLPEAAVKESKDRVRSALLNARFEYPQKRITINLAPADLPKEGGRFDLPIALGILAASGQLPPEPLERYEFLGELALGGELRPVRGVLPAAVAARTQGRAVVVPLANGEEAALVDEVEAFAAGHLLEVCSHLSGRARLVAVVSGARPPDGQDLPDLAEVRGQHRARRALEVAAAGAHNLLFVGPPGTGKTMLASRLPGLLPPMGDEEALESAAVASISDGGFDPAHWGRRPFRAPHHTASAPALVGGGGHPRPGEVSLAHNGVLFLDELPEFDRRVLEVLREPLEAGRVVISRAARRAEFPARFQLVAAMNPCPCGYLGDPGGRCRCSPDVVARYRGRISGPLLDRIDLHLEVPPLPHGELLAADGAGEPTSAVRERVVDARARALVRAGKPNSLLTHRELMRDCALTASDRALLEAAMQRLGLSARGLHRVLRVARTVADLAVADRVATPHLTEALSYRSLDRHTAAE